MGKYSDGCPESTGHTGRGECSENMWEQGHGHGVSPKSTCFIATEQQQLWMSKMATRHLEPHAAGRALIALYNKVSPTAIAWLKTMPRTSRVVGFVWRKAMTPMPV